MIQIQAFVLFVDFLSQTLTQSLNFLVQGKHLIFVIEILLSVILLSCDIRCRQRLCGLLQSRQQVICSLGRNSFLSLVARLSSCLCMLSKALLAKVLLSTIDARFEDNFESRVRFAILSQRRLWSNLCFL